MRAQNQLCINRCSWLPVCSEQAVRQAAGIWVAAGLVADTPAEAESAAVWAAGKRAVAGQAEQALGPAVGQAAEQIADIQAELAAELQAEQALGPAEAELVLEAVRPVTDLRNRCKILLQRYLLNRNWDKKP